MTLPEVLKQVLGKGNKLLEHLSSKSNDSEGDW